MKKLVALLLTLCMVLSVMVFASAETLTGSAQGFGSEVKVELTVEDGKIVDLKVKDSGESYPVPRKDSVGKVIAAIIEANGTEGVDVNTGATFTCAAVVEAVNKSHRLRLQRQCYRQGHLLRHSPDSGRDPLLCGDSACRQYRF